MDKTKKKTTTYKTKTLIVDIYQLFFSTRA